MMAALLLAVGAARAEEPAPPTPLPTSAVTIENSAATPAHGPVSSGLMVANSDGLASVELTTRWSSRILEALATPKIHYVTGNAILNGTATKLGSAESDALLAMPELLLSSTRAPQLLATEWVVLVDVGEGDNPVMRPIAVDVPEHDRHPLSEVKGKNTDDTLKQLALEVNSFVDQTVEHPGSRSKATWSANCTMSRTRTTHAVRSVSTS